MSLCSACTQFKPIYQCSDTLEIGTVPAGTYLVILEDLTSQYRRVVPVTLGAEGVISINIVNLATDHNYRVTVDIAASREVQAFTIGGETYECGEFLMQRAQGDVQETQKLVL